jgi:hypothetical protein
MFYFIYQCVMCPLYHFFKQVMNYFPARREEKN